MLHMFNFLDSGVVVTVGPCGFIPVRLSIFYPNLGKSVPLYKLPRGNIQVPITVYWSGHLVEVEYGWLNSGFRTIFCVSPEITDPTI